MAARWQCIAVGGALALAACGESGAKDSGAPDHSSRPATEYAGVVLERAEELPASDGAVSGSATGDVAAARTVEFFQRCARRLRDPRDGRELLLKRSQITTSMRKKSDTTVTKLDHAIGDYARVSDGPRGQSDSLNLRVDCVSGRALRWVAPGA